jgi:hypothetical protein
MALIKLNARSASALDATILTGALPAISGASLTGITTGKILQVTTGTATGTSNNGTDDLADTGCSAALTPSATSSKILILADMPYSCASSTDRQDIMGGFDMWGDIGSAGYNKLSGSGSFAEYYSLGYSDAEGNRERRLSGRYTCNMLWSPSTTSACTVKFRSHNNSQTTISAQYDSTAHITLMEVGA